MALAHFQRTFTDTAGNAIASLEVEVRNEATGAKAAIFTDKEGSTPRDNPFTTDAFGYGDFYVASGRYRVTAENIDWRNEDLLTFEALAEAVEDAENAADAALLNSGVYDDTTAGLASTVDGDYFSVPSGDGEGYLDLYRNDAEVATLIDTYPNKTAIDNFLATLGSADPGEGASRVNTESGESVQERLDALDGVVDGLYEEFEFSSLGSDFNGGLLHFTKIGNQVTMSTKGFPLVADFGSTFDFELVTSTPIPAVLRPPQNTEVICGDYKASDTADVPLIMFLQIGSNGIIRLRGHRIDNGDVYSGEFWGQVTVTYLV